MKSTRTQPTKRPPPPGVQQDVQQDAGGAVADHQPGVLADPTPAWVPGAPVTPAADHQADAPPSADSAPGPTHSRAVGLRRAGSALRLGGSATATTHQ